MNRRKFLASSCVAGLTAIVPTAIAGQSDEREYYELRKYLLDTEQQKDRMETFIRDAAIPAYNRIGIDKVGVFYPNEGDISPLYVLLVHKSLESFASARSKLLADEEFLSKGSDVFDTPSSNPAYRRVESQLMMAFEKMPKLEVPVTVETRIFQLRKYESHSIKAGQKKIEMFNVGEIEIFRKTGMNPVFFGESLIDSVLPNLTYMLSAEDMEQSRASWSTFMRDPDWQSLRSTPGYSDREIVSNITNLYLKPAAYSQI